MLIPVDQLENSASRYATPEEPATRGNISDFNERALIPDDTPAVTQGPILGEQENLALRKEMLSVVKQEPVDFAFERAIGKNDSVYSNFVELIRLSKQKVGRIVVKNGSRNIAFATGFMVAPNLMLTNWHVFPTLDDVADSEIQFHYELDTVGNPETAISFRLQSDVFYFSNKDLDYCFVAVNSLDISNKINLSDIGYLFLDPSLGKLGNEDQEALNIIHHPDGDYMQLSIRENLFVKITPISIWYKTDTAPGSSGSPVFNDQWQVVALHHMGVAKKNDAGDYIDKDGNIIPRISGQIDVSKVVWEANEGMRISVILKDLFDNFPDRKITNGLKIKPEIDSVVQPPVEEKPESPKEVITPSSTQNPSIMESNQFSNNVTISFPPSLLEKNGIITITINQGGQEVKPIEKPVALVATADELAFAETKKLEDSMDFSLCKGYQSRFLGSDFDIALPQPQKELTKFIAKIKGTDSQVLKYFNYSTIFHSVRMVPVISAINVNGDPAQRLDTSERKDVWLRDNRLSFDIQLDDKYYNKSGFDRGHMSRREDADWGATAEDAKRNADLTCMYTNACPQVPKINQSSRKGLWGILEKVVLESGAEVEKGKTAKISVFNGPIFKDDDPVFRGIQVPMDFYKIVLWLTDNGKLKATAFTLTQEKLVSDIDFEELDLDQNTQFKEFQCSIKSLQEKTKIDFSALFPFDTFEGDDTSKVALNSEGDVKDLINKHNN